MIDISRASDAPRWTFYIAAFHCHCFGHTIHKLRLIAFWRHPNFIQINCTRVEERKLITKASKHFSFTFVCVQRKGNFKFQTNKKKTLFSHQTRAHASNGESRLRVAAFFFLLLFGEFSTLTQSGEWYLLHLWSTRRRLTKRENPFRW